MKSRKILTVLLATLILTTSSMPVFAQGNNNSSKEREKSCYKNYQGIAKNEIECKDTEDENECTKLNVSEALKKATYNAIKLAAKQGVPKTEVKDGIDVNNLSKSSVSEALKNAMAKAKEIKPVTDVNKVLRDQIKNQYEAMKVIEKDSKELLMQAIEKQKQVREFIMQLAQGKITYTDVQLSSIGGLSGKLHDDVQIVIVKSEAIKAAKEDVKASISTQDYTGALVKLLQDEVDARTERGLALKQVNTDLAGILNILAAGKAVVPVVPVVPVTPVTPV